MFCLLPRNCIILYLDSNIHSCFLYGGWTVNAFSWVIYPSDACYIAICFWNFLSLAVERLLNGLFQEVILTSAIPMVTVKWLLHTLDSTISSKSFWEKPYGVHDDCSVSGITNKRIYQWAEIRGNYLFISCLAEYRSHLLYFFAHVSPEALQTLTIFYTLLVEATTTPILHYEVELLYLFFRTRDSK